MLVMVVVGAVWLVAAGPGRSGAPATRTHSAASTPGGVSPSGSVTAPPTGGDPCADAALAAADRWARDVYRDLVGRLSSGQWPATVYLSRRRPSVTGPGMLGNGAQAGMDLDPALYACLTRAPSGLGLDRFGVELVVPVESWDDPAIRFTGSPGPSRTIPGGRLLVLSELHPGGQAGASAVTGSVTLTDGGQDSRGLAASFAPDPGGRPRLVGDIQYWIS